MSEKLSPLIWDRIRNWKTTGLADLYKWAQMSEDAETTNAELLEALKTTREALLSWQPLFPDDWDSGDTYAANIAEQAIRNVEEQDR